VLVREKEGNENANIVLFACSAKDEKHMDDAVYDLAHKFTGRNKIIA
jgi:hypothetical protein